MFGGGHLLPECFPRLSIQANHGERVLSVRAYEVKEMRLGLVSRIGKRLIFDNDFDRS